VTREPWHTTATVALVSCGDPTQRLYRWAADAKKYAQMTVAWTIVERKRAELARQSAEQRFRSLFETMAEGFALCEMIDDEAGQPVDFRYLEINPAFTRLTGLPAEGLVGRTVKEVLPGIESQWIEAYGRVVRTGVAERIENRVETLGKQLDVHAWRTEAGRFAVVFSDVTERRQTEERPSPPRPSYGNIW